MDIYYLCTPEYSDSSCDFEDDMPSIAYYKYINLNKNEALRLIENEKSVYIERLKNLKEFEAN